MLRSRPVDKRTPIEVNHRLGANAGVPERNISTACWKIDLSFSHSTRHTYAVSILSQFMHDPRTSHLEAVHLILQYVKSAPRKGILFFNHGHLKLEAFTDAERVSQWTTNNPFLVNAPL